MNTTYELLQKDVPDLVPFNFGPWHTVGILTHAIFETFSVFGNFVVILALISIGYRKLYALGKVGCLVNGIVHVSLCIVSLLSCFGMTAERYLLVVHRIQMQKTHIIRYYIPAVFAYSMLVSFSPFFFGQQGVVYSLQLSNIHCTGAWNSKESAGIAFTALCLVSILIPVSFIGVAYYQMFMVVRRAGKGLRIGSGGGSSTQNDSSSRSLSKSKTELGVKNQKPDVKKPSRADLETRVLHQGIIIVLSFLTGWTPYLLFMFYEVISKTPTSVGYETFAIAFV
ncbi:hypothetical protein HDU92_007487, partial [Lobulomyces angularis]